MKPGTSLFRSSSFSS
uniref:Uncharacterized protein n=1 Tax=Rhizophora mucronata TaxID=61149 RepID=A0A2P2K216_RHIMU